MEVTKTCFRKFPMLMRYSVIKTSAISMIRLARKDLKKEPVAEVEAWMTFSARCLAWEDVAKVDHRALRKASP